MVLHYKIIPRYSIEEAIIDLLTYNVDNCLLD